MSWNLCAKKRSYHRLKSGRFLSLESENYKQMEDVLQMLEVRKKRCPSKYASTTLSWDANL